MVQEVGGSTLFCNFLFFSKVSKNREKRLISDDTSASSSVAQGVGGFTVNQDVEGSTLPETRVFFKSNSQNLNLQPPGEMVQVWLPRGEVELFVAVGCQQRQSVVQTQHVTR